MSAALVTAILIGLGGLGYATVLGFGAASSADLLRHATAGIFATLVTLLAHSMTMFYLIGKGRAIREAVAEGGLPAPLYTAVARARRPVFSLGVAAMGATMAAAVLGGAVDTGAVPTAVHTLLAALALAANVAVLRVELVALRTAADAVTEVNAQLARAAEREPALGPGEGRAGDG